MRYHGHFSEKYVLLRIEFFYVFSCRLRETKLAEVNVILSP